MQALTNPYTPNAGVEPQAVVGRDDQLSSFDLLLARIEAGRTEQSMIITGLRGVGKTVLLGQLRSRALAREWVVVELEVSKNDESEFRRDMAARLRATLFQLSPKARWTGRFQHAASVLRSFTVSVDAAGTWSAGLDVEAAEGFADHANLALDLTDVFVAIGEAATERGRGVVLLFDEIQFLSKHQLEAVIEALHKMVQRKLPITMVSAGLPQIAELAGDAKSYAERLFKFPAIGNLSAKDARAALSRPADDEGITYAEDALDEAVAITGGYPYFLQELGHAVWTVAEGPVITRDDILTTVPGYEAKLDESPGLEAVRSALRGGQCLPGGRRSRLQEIFHFRLHVFPRFSGDRFRIDADWKQRSRPLLDAEAASVRSALGDLGSKPGSA